MAEPVSLTSALLDQNGAVLIPKDSDIVGHFRDQWKITRTLFGWVPMDERDRDLSEFLRGELARCNGNAIVRFKVNCITGPNFPLTPFYSDMTITIEGDVVRVPVSTVKEQNH